MSDAQRMIELASGHFAQMMESFAKSLHDLHMGSAASGHDSPASTDYTINTHDQFTRSSALLGGVVPVTTMPVRIISRTSRAVVSAASGQSGGGSRKDRAHDDQGRERRGNDKGSGGAAGEGGKDGDKGGDRSGRRGDRNPDDDDPDDSSSDESDSEDSEEEEDDEDFESPEEEGSSKSPHVHSPKSKAKPKPKPKTEPKK